MSTKGRYIPRNISYGSFSKNADTFIFTGIR